MKPQLISIFKFGGEQLEHIISYKVWAKIVNATTYETVDSVTGEKKDLLVFLTAQAQLVLVEFGHKEVHHVS